MTTSASQVIQVTSGRHLKSLTKPMCVSLFVWGAWPESSTKIAAWNLQVSISNRRFLLKTSIDMSRFAGPFHHVSGKNGSVCLSAEWQPLVSSSELHHSGIIDVGVPWPLLGPHWMVTNAEYLCLAMIFIRAEDTFQETAFNGSFRTFKQRYSSIFRAHALT